MARTSSNDRSFSRYFGKLQTITKISTKTSVITRYFGNSLQFTNCILDSGAAYHMTPQVQYFIPGLLEDTDKYTEVAEGN